MPHGVELGVFLLASAVASVGWGRINRVGYSRAVTATVRLIMKYSKTDADLVQSYVVWTLYMATGLAAAVALLAAFQLNLLRYLGLAPRYVIVIPLAFIAQNAMTGLLMQLWLAANPGRNVFADLTSTPWVRYTLMLPRAMRVMSPLCAAIVEEVFFRGAVFLILVERFPDTGPYIATLVCTILFVVQQVLQTDTVGQGVIFAVGSTSISVVGCIATLYTHSFLPTLLCHTAYAAVYLQLGSAIPRMPMRRQPKRTAASGSAYPSF